MFELMTPEAVRETNNSIGAIIFLGASAFFAYELIRYAMQKRMSWSLAGDSVTNYLTFAISVVGGIALYSGFEAIVFGAAFSVGLLDIPVTWSTTIACVILADLIYYWEHRFTHRVAAGWATHSVHHSSPHFNISVAYRFGPMDLFWPIFFHTPAILLGFNPIVLLASAAFVQTYQAILHTEAIPKLWRWIEYVMNTPSHHRVHHGRNAPYMDKNYGGIFIIWDRMFGTFAEEAEPVDYGITTQLDSVNPVPVLFHGFTRLARSVKDAGTWRARGQLLVAPPDQTETIVAKSR